MKKVLFLPVLLTILFALDYNAYSYTNVVTVRPGTTLGQIANEHNTTVAEVMSLNGLRSYVIYPGERLKVPSGGGSYRPARPSYGHYRVQFGDTLSSIAQKYGTSIAELRTLNRLYSNVIRQGAVITVPLSGAGRYASRSVPAAYITVRPGTTLGQIANEHNTTVAEVMSLNGLRSYVIYPGERLKVPSGGGSYRPARPSYGHYRVQFGDTLSSIAQKYGTSIAELRTLNRLYSNVIRQGAVITVPLSGAGRYASRSVPAAYITVRPGTTLGQIANEHNTTVAEVMSLNGLRSYVIYPGERLKVPSGGGSYRPARPSYGHYRVQFGDTLSSIAQKYGTSIAELRTLNRLYSNVIRQGAVITVPLSYKTYRNARNGSGSFTDNDKKYAYYGGSYNTATFKVLGTGNNGANCIKPSVRKAANANNKFGFGKKIVNVAYRYKGVPYVWGGTTRASGMDCSGLVQHVFLKLGVSLPRTAAEQARLGTYVPKDNLKPGDLLFFRTYAPYISHVGIYVGHGKFIQENSGAGKVTVNSLSDGYFERTYAFAKAVK